MQSRHVLRVVMVLALAIGWTTSAQASTTDANAAPESKRLARAKDLIADEQWLRAIEELRVAVADAKEPRRDEALYWLAHSLNQSGDQASAVETIGRLENDFPSSMWVKPARSLRVEIAVRLKRSDVLWWTAMPPPPPTPVKMPAAPVKDVPTASPKFPKVAMPPPPPKAWYSDKIDIDPDLQVQALGALLKTDGERVVRIHTQRNPDKLARIAAALGQ